MNQIKLEIENGNDKKNEIAEKLEVVHNANIETEEELLQHMTAKDVKNRKRLMLLV